jgi:hypothetical protein
MKDALPNATTAIQEFMESLPCLHGVRQDVADVLRSLWESGELGRQRLLAQLQALEGEEDHADGQDQTP